MKATKVKEEGINLISIIFLLIMLSMVNFHISIGKKMLVPFVVWLTIVFLDVGKEWQLTGKFLRKGGKKPKFH